MKSIISRPSKFYSPLRYPGGKAKLTEFLSNVIEKNKISGCTYIEPYAGGAGAALSLLILEKVDRIVINDFDKAIYSLWDILINDHKYLIDKIREKDISIKEWNKQRDIYQDPDSNKYELGFATFYLNRTNHSGIIEGRPIGGFDQSSKWGIGARYKKETLIKRIKKIALYNSRIDVTNKDGIQLMNDFDHQNGRQLFYIDPPYYVKGSSLYLNHYESSDHKALADFLNKNVDLNWILTYDNVPEILELYADRSRKTFDINYSANTHRKAKELMIYSNSISFPTEYEE
ncbi:DNA adenine methylase [Fodinibius sp. Rm-B-1B1-1]|uniref:DNA adenine methylase n=1 Tax=Fodinibius alkaliphilus TaxID=3140241 RepID=UPI003159F0B4